MSLETLVLKAKNGDKASLAELLNRFKPFIIKTCKSIYISGYEFEDLVQIGNLTLLKAIEKYDLNKNNNFISYATASIKNNYYYEIRQKSKINFESSLNKEIEEGMEILDNIRSEEDLEQNYLLKEDIALLGRAIDKLSPLEKELIQYVYIDGGKVKHFANSKGLNYVTCIKMKDRVLKKLRRLMT